MALISKEWNEGDKFSERSRTITLPSGAQKREHELELADFGLMVGDLVVLSGQGINGGGIVFRLARDCPPVADARLQTIHKRGHWPGHKGYDVRTWVRETKSKKQKRPSWIQVPDVRLRGCIELRPVYSFFPHKPGTHVVAYTRLPKQVKKLGLVDLCTAFAGFQHFVNDELRRLRGDEPTPEPSGPEPICHSPQ